MFLKRKKSWHISNLPLSVTSLGQISFFKIISESFIMTAFSKVLPLKEVLNTAARDARGRALACHVQGPGIYPSTSLLDFDFVIIDLLIVLPFSSVFLQNTERSKDWYKTMFKQIHKLNRGTSFHLHKSCDSVGICWLLVMGLFSVHFDSRSALLLLDSIRYWSAMHRRAQVGGLYLCLLQLWNLRSACKSSFPAAVPRRRLRVALRPCSHTYLPGEQAVPSPTCFQL